MRYLQGLRCPTTKFIGVEGPVRLSQLFDAALEPYLVMYWADDDSFCPMCSGWIDALNGVAPHVRRRVSFVAASQAPPQRFQQWARQRGWDNLSVLSDVGTQLADAISARDEDGDPVSTVAVFSKRENVLRHVYTMHPDDVESGNGRGIDLLNPVWHVFDLTPAGRGDLNLSNDYVRMRA